MLPPDSEIVNSVGCPDAFDTWGSLAGNGDVVNGVTTLSNLTVGGNNLSTVYSGNVSEFSDT